MTDLITGEAVAKHIEYLEDGGDQRVIHEGVHRGFRWGIVDMLGRSMLIIKPITMADDCYGHGISRQEAALYLDTNGLVTKLLFADAIDWLEDMGKEPTKDNLHAIADIVARAWPLWWQCDGTPERSLRPIGGLEARLTDAVGRPLVKKDL